MFKPHNILVPIDFSEESDRALDDAFTIAKRFHSKVHLLHVIQNRPQQCAVDYCLTNDQMSSLTNDMFDDARKKLQKEIRRVKKPGNIPISTDIRTGAPSDVILEEQKDRNIDLIVIASHKKHGLWSYLLGSTSQKVVKKAGCETLVVK